MNQAKKFSEASERIAMFHEAGHAVVAMHYGKKVYYMGLDPIPHAIVSQRGLTDHQRGVLLVAGAMMTQAAYGIIWGQHTDYAMAKTLGNIEDFEWEARMLTEALLPAAKVMVDTILGAPQHSAARSTESVIPQIKESRRKEFVDVAKRAAMPKFLKGIVGVWAKVQMARPALFAKLSKNIW